MPETLSTRALCSLDDIKRYAQIDADDQGQDDIIIRLINAASNAIHTVASREFKPVGTQPQTRNFHLPLRGYRELLLGDLAILTTTVVNGVTLDAGSVFTLPRVRAEWEPIRRLRFDDSVLLYGSASDWAYAHIDVTGTWGFPLVPEDIRQACIVTAMTWLERDLRTFSATFSLEEARVELPRTLPQQVFDTVRQYQPLVITP